ncbi:MAG: hypothetical protein JW850_15785 [Thermoflexales bacterium]|nr:hypothetical protein [Thermoflexales bacterium]
MGAPRDNKNGLVHGAAAAEKRLWRGESVTGVAAEVALQALREIEADPLDVLRHAAAQQEAIARLYFDAFLAAAERQDFDAMETYQKAFGPHRNGAVRALLAIIEQQKKQAGGLGAGDVLEVVKNEQG